MISRAMSKAVKQAGKQQQANTRGLSGNRNSQGDFMTGENQLDTDRFAASEMMARDEVSIQNYINNVKAQIDEIDAQLYEINSMDTDVDTPGINKEIQRLESQRDKLLQDLMDDLIEEGVEVPPQLAQMINEDWQRKQDQLDADSNTQAFEEYDYPDTL